MYIKDKFYTSDYEDSLCNSCIYQDGCYVICCESCGNYSPIHDGEKSILGWNEMSHKKYKDFKNISDRLWAESEAN